MQLVFGTIRGLLAGGLLGVLGALPLAAGPTMPPQSTGLESAFTDLYETLGRDYPCLALKKIQTNESTAVNHDWQLVLEIH